MNTYISGWQSNPMLGFLLAEQAFEGGMSPYGPMAGGPGFDAVDDFARMNGAPGFGGQPQIAPQDIQLLIELMALAMLMNQLNQMNGGNPMSGMNGCTCRGFPSFGQPGPWASGRPMPPWGNYPSGNMSDLGPMGPSWGGNSNALSVAQSVLGHNISELKYNGPLAPVLDKWPGNNVCCANFVSACLERAGQINHSEHNDSVSGLASNLSRDPRWSRTSLANARPGDVVCLATGHGAMGHVVMFAGWGADGRPRFIGSNNRNPDGSQRVTECAMNYPVTAVFHYHG